ncbi:MULTISPECIES: ABC transporter permease [Micromonospora]|uniref:ABC-2 type transport system permease protein n=1 Tax=Micromonospora yangpuensis TaxID=683228 RepID=A0A1C6US21_9ACTN|nr:anibiotic ABC transporter [Micromonospora yangpuensis]GGM06723.1 exporter of polyketide antibiotics [Micromonospora yangpuensis]SCL56740.1 ABC-2 type transport system permease protein [Micromonospora yangpuensis]
MSAVTGTGRLVRLALRRDRVKLGLWVFGTPLLANALAASIAGIYPGESERVAYARTATSSLVARAFNGPVHGTSLGSVVTTESFLTLSVLAALLSTFAVVRHTRQNEETGRAELLGSAVVGRYALLTAALLVVIGANLLTTVGVAVALVAAGLPVAGSVAAAAAVGSIGISFAAVAGLTAQFSGTSRGANALAALAVGVAFALRAAGDVFGQVSPDGLSYTSGWPSWLSPLGWGNQLRPFDGERWWVLLLPVGLLVVAVVAAYRLTDRRDLGAGLLADRPGPATATAAMRSPIGLAWHLQRGVLLGWAVGIGVLGLAMGAVSDEIDDMVAENPTAAEMVNQLGGGAVLVEAYLSAMLALFALTIGGYVVQALLRARTEETDGVLEAVLATSVDRYAWLGAHLLNTVLGATLLTVVGGASTGLGQGLVTGDPVGRTVDLSAAALVRLPALLVLAGIVVVLIGVLPRWSVPLSWATLLLFLLVGQLGAVLELPQPVLDVSPFTHVPAAPAVDATALPLVVLTAVAAALAGAGLVAFRRRDLTP